MSTTQETELPILPAKNARYASVQNPTDQLSAILLLHDLLNKTQTLVYEEFYDPIEDFRWFTSGELDTSSFKGKYIAIWKKQVVANGNDATEVENIAKAYNGENCKPAVVYIPEDENAIL